MKIKSIIFIVLIIVVLIISYILYEKLTSTNNDYKEEIIEFKDSKLIDTIIMPAVFDFSSKKEAISYFWTDESEILSDRIESKAGCLKLFWKEGKNSSEKIDFGESSELIKSPGSIYIDDNGQKFIMSLYTYFTVIDKDGNLIKQTNIERIIGDKIPDGFRPLLFNIDGDIAYILYEKHIDESNEDSGHDYYMVEMRWSAGEFVSKYEIKGAYEICLFDGNLYGYDEDKNLVIIDRENNIIKTVTKPKGSGQIKISKNEDGIFYMNNSGIYMLSNDSDTFEKLVNSFGMKSISETKDVVSFYVDEDENVHVIKTEMDSFEYYLLVKE